MVLFTQLQEWLDDLAMSGCPWPSHPSPPIDQMERTYSKVRNLTADLSSSLSDASMNYGHGDHSSKSKGY